MKTHRVWILFILTATVAALTVNCRKEQEAGPATWREILESQLPVLGHRNWVVVADSAFPAYTRPGITVIATGKDHIKVLAEVLQAIDSRPHIRPHIYLDKELDYVAENDAPGMDACRKRLAEALAGRDARPILHRELIDKLDEVAGTFRVLMLKTTLALPYTSVFIELDCGYWTEEGEARMREKMKVN
jgi:hypothetical protein